MFNAMLHSLFLSRCVAHRGRRPRRRAGTTRARGRWVADLHGADVWAARRRRPSRLRGGISLAAEGLEPRLALDATGDCPTVDLVFNIPAATAALGVQIGVYSNENKVYLDPTKHNDGAYHFTSYTKLKPASLLPSITLVAPATTVDTTVTLPVSLDTDVVSGELIIFVGDVATGLPFNGSSVSTPKSAPNPAVPTTPDTFAQFEFNYTTRSSTALGGLDIDISSVDSTGFPFTLVYPQSGQGKVGYPLNPLGITVSHEGLNRNLAGFLDKQGKVNGTSVSNLFGQCATYVQQQDPTSLQVVAPGDILANGTIGPTMGFTPQRTNTPISSCTTAINAASTLAAGATYSYLVTAYSDNLIDGTQIHGETLPSAPVTSTPLTAGQEIQITWTPYRDPNTAGYNIYRYASTDGTPPTDATLYNLVGSVSGMLPASGDYFTFTDAGLLPWATQISVAAASPYGFNPLSEYYTQALKDFFEHYEAPNSFAIQRDGVLWQGNTVEYAPSAPWNAGGYTYRMLQLTAQNESADGAIPDGAVVNIYEPFFSTNTRFVKTDAPPMPSWLQKGTSQFESPAEMVFGCDGVFASNAYDPDSFGAGGSVQPVGDIENSIVSAFNRGIATSFYDATNKTGLVPDNWASFPNFTTPQTVDRSTPTKNLYYAVTAVNVYGETTPSATVFAKQGSLLTWANGANAAPATHYNVYAGTSPNRLYLQTTTTSPTFAAPAFTSQATPLPNRYFAPSSTSNFYAAYVSSDSLLDPEKGVSINGLSYGYAYSDQGGVSTNLFFPNGTIPGTVEINLGVPSGPGFVTQMLPTASVGSPYTATIIPSGVKKSAPLTFSIDPSTTLPAWAALQPDGTITGTPGDAGSWTFTVMGQSGGTKITKSYTLTATTGATAALSAAGLTGDVLSLPDADVGVPYTAKVVPTGGAGGPYFLALDPTKTAQLPAGISLALPTRSGSTGAFTLSGSQTEAQTAGISVVMSDKTAAVASAGYGISTAQFTLGGGGSGYKVGDRFPVTVTDGSGRSAAIVVTGIKGNGTITTWDVQPGTGFTNATGLKVSSSATNSQGTKKSNGSGASFTLAPNPGTLFQPVVTILNGGSYTTPPTAAFYAGGAPVAGSVRLTGTAVTSVTGPAQFTASTTPLLVYITPPAAAVASAIYGISPAQFSLTNENGGQGYAVGDTFPVTATSKHSTTPGDLGQGAIIVKKVSAVTNAITEWGVTTTTGFTSASVQLVVGSSTSKGSGASFTLAPNPGTLFQPVVTILNGGSYTTPPTAAFYAGGAPVAGTVRLTGTAVTSVTGPAQFSASPTPPLVLIDPPAGANLPFTMNLTVNPKLEVTTTSLPAAVVRQAYNQLLTTNNTGTVTFSLASGSLPAGLSLKPWGLITGTATTAAPGQSFTVKVTDAAGGQTTQTLAQGIEVSTGIDSLTVTPTSLPPATPSKKYSQFFAVTGGVSPYTYAVVNGSLPTGFSLTPIAKPKQGFTIGTTSVSTAEGAYPFTVRVTDAAGRQAFVGLTLDVGTPARAVTITPSTATVAPSGSLVIAGSGFSTTPADNVVTLSTGKAAVTAATATSLTLAFTSPPVVGPLKATVTVQGVASALTQVATVPSGSAKPTVNQSQASILSNQTTLEITGTGFSTTAGETAVTLLESDQQTQISFTGLTVNSPTSLTLTGISLDSYTTGGAVNATVTVNGITSTMVQVGTDLGDVGANVIPPSPDGFAANGSVLVVNGQGFTSSSTVTVTPQYSTGAGPALTVKPRFDSPNRLVLTGLDIPTTNLVFSGLPSGSNYTSSPTVVFSGGDPGTGGHAKGTAVVSNGQVTTINVTTPGNYTSAPTVTISGGQPTITGSSAVGAGTGLGKITGLSSTDAANAQAWLTTCNNAAPFSGPGIPATAVINSVDETKGELDFAFNPQQTFEPTSTATFSLGLNATATASLATLQSIQVALINPSVTSVEIATPIGTKIPAPTVTGGTLVSNAQGGSLTIVGTGFQKSGTIDVQLFSGPDAQSLTPLDGFVATSATGSGVQAVTVVSTTQLTVTLAGPLPAGNVWAKVVSAGVPGDSAGLVATVVGPSLTTSTTSISPAPITLSINGNGFATASGSINDVQLFTGPNSGSLTPVPDAIVSVVATSPTSLEVTLDGAEPLPAGPLWATVTVDGFPLGTAQIATVAAAGQGPDITASSGGLAKTATSLTIAGSGFSTAPNGNTVQLFTIAGPLGSPIVVTTASATALVVPLTAGMLTAGPLYATVTTAAASSAEKQVATVVPAAAPTVTTSTLLLAANARQLVITGTGFSTTKTDNTVVLSSGEAKVVASSATSLTLGFTTPPTTGPLAATVTSNGVAGSGTPVATVVAASTPTVTASTAVLSTSATTLTINGSGFDTNAGATNLVTLSSGTVSKVTVDSSNQLTVSLGAPPSVGELFATVTVDGVASPQAQVAKVGTTPVVTSASVFLAANAGQLMITGTGFDPVPANNNVMLSSGNAVVMSATTEALVLSFTKQPRVGQLKAVVVSGGFASVSTQVATVHATVTPAIGPLPPTATRLTITGSGFDATTPANNVVALSSGAGTVTKATATSLTVTFTAAPTLGPLTATVIVGGVSNPGLPLTQVATIVPGPASAVRTTLATSAATAAVGMPVTLTLQTFDAGGNPLATGGARVSFASSALGTFSKVTDNGDGTYAATFTTQRVGSATFSASVNRVKVVQTATTGFVFASQFPGSAPVAPWSVRAGGFATVFGTALGTTASNIAIYSGAVAANVTVSAHVSNLESGQFGGVVARYASRVAHYRAGLVVEGGQTYAVIQAVGARVTTLSRQAVAFPGAGYVGFTVSGSSLTMTLNGITVGQATSRAYRSGTAGISGGTGVGFADFSMG